METSTVTVLNGDLSFSADFGQCILDSGLAQGIALPHQCRGASCGQCKAYIEHGSVNHGWSFSFAISDDEKAEGYCLMCQAKPTTPELVIRTVQPMGNQAPTVYERTGTVLAVDQLSKRVRRVSLHVPEAETLFRAGSYVELKLPGVYPNRVYSFANAACDAEQLEFLIALHPSGQASGYLHTKVRAGDTVNVKGPFGNCRLPDGSGSVLGLAGGTGLAPVISIFQSALQAGSSEQFKLLFAVREDDDVFWLDRLAKLTAQYPNFSYELVIAQGPSRFTAQPGLVDAYIAANFYTLEGWRVVAGGSPGFVAACSAACTRLGVIVENISVDSFVDVSATLPLECESSDSLARERIE